MRMRLMATVSVALLSACHLGDGSTAPTEPQAGDAIVSADGDALVVTEVAHFDAPWAMTFLPDGNQLLVTEKGGELKLVQLDSGDVGQISGLPEVVDQGQGGLGDVILAPDFSSSGQIYLSFAEAGKSDSSGAAVARAVLVLDQQGGGKLTGVKVIWRQVPKVQGHGHYGHRLAFGPDGYLWISSGERQKFDPAQNMQSNMGKIVRLDADGSVPKDNPFVDQGRIASQVWSLGHRNPLGIAFDAKGQLWNIEMGPRGGDELNQVVRGGNYGYPVVSNGDHYDGRPIPDHDTQPEYNAPEISWSPVISPASLVIYSGDAFPQWQGNAFIAGLSSAGLIRVELEPGNVREAERFDMGARIREVEQGPAGNLWVLEDGEDGRLLRLSPAVTEASEPATEMTAQ